MKSVHPPILALLLATCSLVPAQTVSGSTPWMILMCTPSDEPAGTATPAYYRSLFIEHNSKAPTVHDYWWQLSDHAIHLTYSNVSTKWFATSKTLAQLQKEGCGQKIQDCADAWVHPNGSINSTWWDGNQSGGAWDTARVFGVTNPGTAASGAVAVAARTPDHLDLFWVHPNGSINSTWWDGNVEGGAWNPARVFGVTAAAKAVPGAITVVARTANHLDLFWVHPEGSINATWWDGSTARGGWDARRVFGVTGSGSAVPGAIAAVARTPDHLDLFWVHPEGSINATWWDGTITGGNWDPMRVFAVTAPGKALRIQ